MITVVSTKVNKTIKPALAGSIMSNKFCSEEWDDVVAAESSVTGSVGDSVGGNSVSVSV